MTFTPFAIHCPTCRRSLTVRSAAAIGKILACPQCGSMVLIEWPNVAASDRGVAQEGATGHAPARRSERGLRSDETGKTASQAPLEAAPDPQLADTVPESFVGSVPPPSKPAPAPRAESVGGPARTDEPAVPRAADWVSSDARQMRRWMMVGVSAAAGAIVLIVVVAMTVADRFDQSPGDSTTADAGANTNAVGTETPRIATDGSGPNPPDTRAATNPTQPNVGSRPDGAPPAGQSPLAPSVGAGTPGERTDGGPETPSEPFSGDADRPSRATKVDPAVSPSGAATGPPMPDPMAPRPVPPTTAHGPSAPGTISAARSGFSADAIAREFDGLMSDTTFDREASLGASMFDLIPAPGKPVDAALAVPKPPPSRPVQADAQLGIRVPRIEMADVPLGEFVRFMSDFTNLAITLEIDGVHRQGHSVRTPIRVDITEGDLRSGFNRAMEPIELELIVENRFAIIAPRGARQGYDRVYDVYDLVGEDAELSSFLTNVIFDLFVPAAWEKNGGPGKLAIAKGRMTVATTPALHYEILMLCERLRVARGLRPQGILPDPMAELRPRVALALPRLGSTVSADFAAPAPLTDILGHLSDAGGVDFVVNWYALDEAGWHRDAMARLQVADATLADSLWRLLAPMGLSFRVIDATTLQITTSKEAFQTAEVELFRIPDAAMADEGRRLTRGLRAIVEDPTASSGSGVRFDPKSRTLIVVAPQHGIAAVSRLLERLAVPAAGGAGGAVPVIE